MTQNPNWPYMELSIAFDAGPSNPTPTHWLAIRNRDTGQITTNRGRQYELDQVQTGTWAGTLQNKDGAFDPSNTSSPFYPKVVPYRAFRHRAQYPYTPANILTPDQATAFYSRLGAGGAGSTLPANVVCTAGASHASIVNSGAVNHYRVSMSIGDAFNGFEFLDFSLEPGATYTAQCQISATLAAQSWQLVLAWYDMNGNIPSAAKTIFNTTTGAQTITLTATVPAGMSGAILIIEENNAAAPSAYTADIWNVQIEKGSSASAFTTPGTWYSLYTGYVERWPQSWSMNGQFGVVNPVVVDAFGYLSQRKLLSSFYQEVLTQGPTFFYPLDESTGTTRFYDLSGNRRSIFLTNPAVPSPAKMASGAAIAAPGPGWTPQGIPGPCLATGKTQTYSNPASQFLDLTYNGQYASGPATSTWTRVIAFQMPSDSGLAGDLVNLATIGSVSSNNRIQITAHYDGSGLLGNGNGNGIQVTLWQGGTNTAAWAVNSAVNNNMSDGGWHLLIFGASPSGIWGWFDGAAMYTVTTGGFSQPVTFPPAADAIGGTKAGDLCPAGYFACVAEFPFQMSSSGADLLYSAFRYGGSGDGSASSGSRYYDILRWAGWQGNASVDLFGTGECVNYGPSTELNATAAAPGTDAVSALQSVVDTDSGTHYVSVNGTVTFKARRSRYNQGTPQVIFGEQTGSGEVPYTDVSTGYDTTRVANDITTVQTQTAEAIRVLDTTSINAYGDIQLQRTLNTLNTDEQRDAGNYLLRRNSQPVQRVEGISVDVGANPSLWPTMLALELGSRVRVMRRPPLGAATIQVDGFVEQLNWTIDDKGHAYVDLQISVNNNQQYWQLDSSTYSVLDSTSIIGY